MDPGNRHSVSKNGLCVFVLCIESLFNTGTAYTINLGSTWSGAWWPLAGERGYTSGTVGNIGYWGTYWSSTRSGTYASYYLALNAEGTVEPSRHYYRSIGISVRCVQEEARLYALLLSLLKETLRLRPTLAPHAPASLF